MRHLLNTLFVTSENVYLSLDGENVLANQDKQVIARYPLHTLQSIISFSYNLQKCTGLLYTFAVPPRTGRVD